YSDQPRICCSDCTAQTALPWKCSSRPRVHLQRTPASVGHAFVLGHYCGDRRDVRSSRITRLSARQDGATERRSRNALMARSHLQDGERVQMQDGKRRSMNMHNLVVSCLVAAYLAANVYAIVKVRVFELARSRKHVLL